MAAYIDVFNGDADGIFSLVQWRKANPLGANDTQYLITGVKRNIALVAQIDDAILPESVITVLDVSFDKNVNAVRHVLAQCSSLFYCDHHKADTLFSNNKLETRIDTAPTVCTGLLIDAELNNEYSLWAIAAAFGDGLDSIAIDYAKRLGLSDQKRQQLKELGVLVNYNGYGSTVADLHFAPDSLFKQLVSYDSPFEVINDKTSAFSVLKHGYEADIVKANQALPLDATAVVGFILEDAPWARRISGTFGNQLAAENPDKPVVIATSNAHGSYTISLRAPKHNLHGASTICSQFATGGGREGAAGVNELPKQQLDEFLAAVSAFYSN